MTEAAALSISDSKPDFLRYGDERIPFYRVVRKSGKQGLSIKVKPDQTVEVQAPVNIDQSTLLKALSKRARWIYNQRKKFQDLQQDVLSRRYVSGETQWYLGRRYLLKVIESPQGTGEVKLLRGSIQVVVQQRDPTLIQALLKAWYQKKAREIFDARLTTVMEKTRWIKSRPKIRVVSMKSRWGSCSVHGNLTLNPHLIKADRECIDYVLIHELCHHAEHNHSAKFYRYLNRTLPTWEIIKRRLDSKAFQFLNI